MTDEELLRYLGTTDDHIRLTVLVRLERPGVEAIIGTLDGPNAWVPSWPSDGLAYASVQTEAMIGLLGPAARVVARAAGHECYSSHSERCLEADEIVAAWVGINDTEINGELFAARDVMLAVKSLTRPLESRRVWGEANGWKLVTETVAINPDCCD
jgi:hypothetical protein